MLAFRVMFTTMRADEATTLGAMVFCSVCHKAELPFLLAHAPLTPAELAASGRDHCELCHRMFL